MGSRRKARECALQMLFEMEMKKEPPENVVPEYWQHASSDDATRDFADRIVYGQHRLIDRIDDLIGKHIENWRLERLAAVDRNILRIAVFELLEEKETPCKVVINEAIEIAKKFGSNESAHFINGVLDGIEKALSSEIAS
ncbi:transcription antitermination factor NusB [Acidobacteriota bacterium]